MRQHEHFTAWEEMMPDKELRKGQRERKKRAKRYSPTRRRNQQPEMDRKK